MNAPTIQETLDLLRGRFLRLRRRKGAAPIAIHIITAQRFLRGESITTDTASVIEAWCYLEEQRETHATTTHV